MQSGFWLLLILLGSSFLNAYNISQESSSRLSTGEIHSNASSAPTILFQATWGGPRTDYVDGVATDSSGNVYASGYTNGSCSCLPWNPFLLKFNSTGSLLWQREWYTSSPSFFPAAAVAVDALGNAYVAGFTTNNTSGDKDAALLKFDPYGSLIWQRKWGGAADDYATGIVLSPTGDLIMVGTTLSFTDYYHGFILKFSSNGTLVWQRTSLGGGWFTGVSEDSLGNAFVSGYSSSNNGASLLKFASNGTLLWEETWGSYGQQTIDEASVAVDLAGNAYETGQLQNYTYDRGGNLIVNTLVPIIKFDSNGTVIWQRVWPSSNRNFCCTTWGNALTIDSAGNIFLIGETAPELSYDTKGMLILELSSSGDLKWEATVGGGKSDVGKGIAIDASGNLIAAGWVHEGPPYGITSLNYPVTSANFSIQPMQGQISVTNTSESSFNESILVANGSATYAGYEDAYIVKLGLPQASLATLTTESESLLLSTLLSALIVLIFYRRGTSRSRARQEHRVGMGD